MPWANFWGTIITAALAIFAIVAAVVTVGGFVDIKAMFQSLREQHEDRDVDPDE